MATHTHQRAPVIIAALLLLLTLPWCSAQSLTDVQGRANCTETDSRLPVQWACESFDYCLSLHNAQAAFCCQSDRACAKFIQPSCDLVNSPWQDRVKTYTSINPRQGCGNGMCCPIGYECATASTKEASFCILNRPDARYPLGIDPDDPQRCINDCEYFPLWSQTMTKTIEAIRRMCAALTLATETSVPRLQYQCQHRQHLLRHLHHLPLGVPPPQLQAHRHPPPSSRLPRHRSIPLKLTTTRWRGSSPVPSSLAWLYLLVLLAVSSCISADKRRRDRRSREVKTHRAAHTTH